MTMTPSPVITQAVPLDVSNAVYLGPLRFVHRDWLWGTLVLALLVVGAFWLSAVLRRRFLARLGHPPQLARMAAAMSPGRRLLKVTMITAGVVALGLSLARPQLAGTSHWRQRGIDLVLVMDFSKSMHALDVRPSRLARARLEANRLIDTLRGDRVGIVAFAGSTVHYPLSTDYEAIRQLFEGLEPADMAPGSNLADALAMARCLLRPDLGKDAGCERNAERGHGGDPLDPDEARRMREQRLEVSDLGDRARAIVLITDGEATEGDAMAEAQEAAKVGIELFVVGVGTINGAPIPDLDRDGVQHGWKTDENGQTVQSKLDDAGLRALAELGGSDERYHRVTPGTGNDPILSALGQLKEGELESRVVRSYNEAYQWFLYPGFLCLLIEAVVTERRRRRPDMRGAGS
jgi:Ca-activated chloride channel family protein